VQHFGEGLCRGFEVKAFSRRVVVGADERLESLVREGCEVGFAWHEASHSADGVFDAALLPGRVGITEESTDGEAVQRAMSCKLGAVVEGDAFAQLRRQWFEQPDEMSCDSIGGFVGRSGSEDDPGFALVHGQDRLAIFGK
jgi:hypothetical protein